MSTVHASPAVPYNPATFKYPSPSSVRDQQQPSDSTASKSLPLAHVTNAEFIAAVFSQVADGSSVAVCDKAGDPTEGGWPAYPYNPLTDQLSVSSNCYLSCSSFQRVTGEVFSVRKTRFSAFHFLLLDDLGTKIPMEKLVGFNLSWLIETSPSNYQGGIILKNPITDTNEADRLIKAVIAAGLCDEGASGVGRWSRLPNAINGKPKYCNAEGKSFQCQLLEWRPDKRYSVPEVINGLELKYSSDDVIAVNNISQLNEDDVWIPRDVVNPVVAALKERSLYKTPLGSGKHDITCPWVQEHTDIINSGTAYFEPGEDFPLGGFKCHHGHCADRHISDLLDILSIKSSRAQHKPVIRIVAGEMHRVVNAAEKVLANLGKFYQSGGLIVSVITDATTGDPSVIPINIPTLTRELSVAANWEKFDGRSSGWVPCDPPQRHTAILYDSKQFRYLSPLAGLARQPYLREADGSHVTLPGYDPITKRFGVFDPNQFPVGEITQESAKMALVLLRNLLKEFSFVSPVDEAATLSAIFTAVVRVSLHVAPAFHVHASIFASGKSYLCELIASFAGSGFSEKISYPTTSEEATKVMLSLLLKNPACVEFDDMDTDWLPHGVIKRMLTAEQISDRILGYSKTATVSTRTLFLGSGNNVGPIRDLLRRVVTIHLDPRVETPATLAYKGDPVVDVRADRGRYVMAVMTIIQAWREAGMPCANVKNIATFDGQWSDYCRHPLIWLGLPDPAQVLIEQVTQDPDRDSLKGLLMAWYAAFKSAPKTVRRAVEKAKSGDHYLYDALREFPIEERGEINHSKLGWILKKNANRIVGGLEFQKSEADGRTAWRVVESSSRTQSSDQPTTHKKEDPNEVDECMDGFS